MSGGSGVRRGNVARPVIPLRAPPVQAATTTTSTDEETESQSNATTGKQKKARLPVTLVYVWRHPDVKLYRVLIGLTAIFMALLLLAVYIMWAFQVIPSIPPSALFYCAVYYLVFILTVVLNIVTPCQRNDGLYTLSLFLNFIATLFIWFIFFTILYQFFGCIAGWFPLNCRDLELVQIILGSITFFIWFFQTAAFILYCCIASRIAAAKSVARVEI